MRQNKIQDCLATYILTYVGGSVGWDDSILSQLKQTHTHTERTALDMMTIGLRFVCNILDQTKYTFLTITLGD